MTRLAPLALLLLTGASPADTPQPSAASQVINAAKPDVGLLDHGQVGIIFYAFLLFIALLLLRDLARDWILRGTLGKLADALNAINIQLSRLESTIMARTRDED